jgi:hypothetical protein
MTDLSHPSSNEPSAQQGVSVQPAAAPVLEYARPIPTADTPMVYLAMRVGYRLGRIWGMIRSMRFRRW